MGGWGLCAPSLAGKEAPLCQVPVSLGADAAGGFLGPLRHLLLSSKMYFFMY